MGKVSIQDVSTPLLAISPDSRAASLHRSCVAALLHSYIADHVRYLFWYIVGQLHCSEPQHHDKYSENLGVRSTEVLSQLVRILCVLIDLLFLLPYYMDKVEQIPRSPASSVQLYFSWLTNIVAFANMFQLFSSYPCGCVCVIYTKNFKENFSIKIRTKYCTCDAIRKRGSLVTSQFCTKEIIAFVSLFVMYQILYIQGQAIPTPPLCQSDTPYVLI